MRKVTVLDKNTLPKHFSTPTASNNENILRAENEIKSTPPPIQSNTRVNNELVLPAQTASLNGHLRGASISKSREPSFTDPKTKLEIVYEQTARRHMYLKTSEKSLNIDGRIERLAKQWTSNLEPSAPCSYDELAHPSRACQESVVTVGRIVCDSDAKLNENSLLLEASRCIGSGIRVPLDVSTTSAYSLFPGQIVMVEGVNPDGRKFHVNNFIQPNNSLKFKPKSMKVDYSKLDEEMVKTVVASGPFTLDDSLDFQPLVKLLQSALSYRPDCLLLLGPFVDSEHSLIKAGKVTELPEQIFQREIFSRLVQFCEVSPSTRILIVPSLRDIFHDYVFPQPALPAKLAGLACPQQISFLSNPSVFYLNEIAVAVSTNDCLLPLAAESIVKNTGPASDRMSRLCGHLLEQAHFYPLMPAANGANIDYSEQLEIPVQPDILILSSALSNFARLVPPQNGPATVCLNPGQLCRKQSMGTAAVISVNKPTTDNVLVANRTRVDFIQFS